MKASKPETTGYFWRVCDAFIPQTCLTGHRSFFGSSDFGSCLPPFHFLYHFLFTFFCSRYSISPRSPCVSSLSITDIKHQLKDLSLLHLSISCIPSFPRPSSASEVFFFSLELSYPSLPPHLTPPSPPPPVPSLPRPWTVPSVFKREAKDFPQSFNLGLSQSGIT